MPSTILLETSRKEKQENSSCFQEQGQETRHCVVILKESYCDLGKDKEVEPQMMKLKHQRADGDRNEEGWGLFQVARMDINDTEEEQGCQFLFWDPAQQQKKKVTPI
jgi:hypothetical protein